MAVMADGLVTYAKDGHEGEDKAQVDLQALIQQVCKDRDLPFDPAEQTMIWGRKVGLARAFGNLIDNALRYGTEVQVSVTTTPTLAITTIEDSGPGIPPDQLDRMFQPFARGDDSRNTQTGGAGLGLSIARTIITSHGGEIGLENRTQGGLRARITLPLAQGDA